MSAALVWMPSNGEGSHVGGAGAIAPVCSKRAVLDAILRSDLAAFIEKVVGTVAPGRVFQPNWHIEAMAAALADVVAGRCPRLIISVPPRHLKSISASVALPAFALGHDPTRRVICVSYSDQLAVKHANDTRAVLASPWYRRLFPGTRVAATKNTEAEIATTRQGFRLSTSVGGTLTGRGGDLVVIDDPIKPADAMSEARREGVAHWYETTLLSRLDDKRTGAIVLVMQRLHEDDLAGRLLAEGGWRHLRLSAIAEADETVPLPLGRRHHRRAGEVLHPAREPIEVLDQLKRAMGSAAFAAQYNQEPVPAGGNMLSWRWFRSYDVLPADGHTLISWDTAMKASEVSDYSVATVWRVVGESYYLIDLVRERLDYPDLKRRAVALYERHRPATLLIEDAGSGTSLIQDLRRDNVHAIGVRPEGDKVLRMSAQSAKVEAGAVHLPRHAPWLDELKAEVLAFPHGRHDDQVDSIAQALAYADRPRLPIAQIGHYRVVR